MKPMYTTAAGLLLHAAGATRRDRQRNVRGRADGTAALARIRLGEGFFLSRADGKAAFSGRGVPRGGGGGE